MAELHSLVKAMQEMKANGGNEYKTAFVKELMFTKFLVPVNISPEPENGVVKKGSVISYMSIKNNEDGRKLLIAFTSKEEYNKFMGGKESTHILTHPYNEIRALVATKNFDGVVIDPLGENVAVSDELMKRIAEAAAPIQVKTEKVVAPEGTAPLTPAENVSDEFKAAMKAYLEAHTEIEKCYLMQTVRANETEPTLVAVLEFEGDMQKIFGGLAASLRKYMKVNDTIGMMSTKDGVAAAAVLDVEPFYVKK